MDLSTLEQIAATKCCKPDGELAREAHKYAVDFYLHVWGFVKKGEDYEALPTPSIPWIATMAAFCCLSGIVGDAAVNLITRSIGMAMEAKGDKTAALFELSAKMEVAVETVKASLRANLTPELRSGKITTDLHAEKVERELIPV